MSDMIRQIDRYLDNDLNDEELSELFGWIGADQTNADFFARQMQLDQHTSELLQDGEIQLHVESAASNTSGHGRRRIIWITAALTMATLLLVTIFRPAHLPE